MQHVAKKTDISLKSRHFAHKGSSGSQGVKPTESSQDLKTQLSQDAKSHPHGSLPIGKDFSDEKKLVIQQMVSKEKQKDASLVDNATVINRTVENDNSEKTENSSAASNAEMIKESGHTPSSVKPAVYSSADIKPRNSTFQGAIVNSSRTGCQTEERTNIGQSDKNSVAADEDGKAKAKPTLSSHTSHLVAANYSFFPGNDESELEQPKNAKVKSQSCLQCTALLGVVERRVVYPRLELSAKYHSTLPIFNKKTS